MIQVSLILKLMDLLAITDVISNLSFGFLRPLAGEVLYNFASAAYGSSLARSTFRYGIAQPTQTNRETLWPAT